MGEHFGVGLGAEYVPALAQRGPQRAGVFDDAVVDQRERASAVGVRMGIDRGGGAVRRPARVRDARPAGRELLAELLLEHAELPRRLVDFDPAVVDQREAGGVVPPVLEPPQPVEQEWGCLPRSGVAYDAAHDRTLTVSSWSRVRIHRLTARIERADPVYPPAAVASSPVDAAKTPLHFR